MRKLLAVALAAIALGITGCSKPQAAQKPSGPVSAFVLANGVRLHYVDWGGNGPALLLLAGFGNDAHVFKTFAPRFTDAFHVYALTRRGFGESDKPAGGYDTATRVEDIREFLDRMQIDRAHLVGHSLAGDELTLFATKYPERVRKLVYLDAAFNRYRMNAVVLSDPALLPLHKRLYLEALGSPEASTIAVDDPQPEEERRVRVAYMRAIDAFAADYRPIRAPALAFYAGPEKNHPRSGAESSLERRKALNGWWASTMIPRALASREQFQRDMRYGEIIVLPDANHFLFTGKTENEVVQKTRSFLRR